MTGRVTYPPREKCNCAGEIYLTIADVCNLLVMYCAIILSDKFGRVYDKVIVSDNS